ncbi:succinylglutamate desuccinylase [Aliiglaciecola sp. LCG003]|uniref:succinylglutamate desuccinylase n=1 Tax=Aliiglaciecola sp. LCG003 TaxID=3053655 RepID=UPI0025736B39|nr:succinylglutamate desuccinylase [Aliiglaciecola sp. LCG003]WJG08232.1 succinylglutamate desuccinylase [Aliiglaciecola sp. LCG003]
MLSKELTHTGEFLQYSRRHPEYFENGMNFDLADGTCVSIPSAGIIIFTPANPANKDIVLSCGVHGNETAPIEICDDLVKSILTGRLCLAQRVMFLFANLPAMDIAERFVEENLNRLFSGAHASNSELANAERLRAKQLEDAVANFFQTAQGDMRLHYDLHTAIRPSKNDKFAVYPFLHGKPHCKQQLALLSACGVNTILLSENPTTTFSYFSSHSFDAHSFTVELGKVRPFGENDMRQFTAVIDTLGKLISQLELHVAEYDPTKMDIFRVNQVINKHQDDFKLHFADDIPNFTDFKRGTLLASETGTSYFTEYDGEAIVFPNAQVALGQRALLTVVPTEL